jgi:4-hydroxy-3-methylbut-2-enyl diphosphate reductase
VSLAVKAAYDESKYDKLYMYGEIVHNPAVIKKLIKNNVSIINGAEEILKISSPKVLIRAHGIPKFAVKLLKENNSIIIDKTCPKVKKIHNVVSKAYEENKKIIIVGNPMHPEVVGINGWCNFSATVVKNIQHANEIIGELNPQDIFCMVSQTTFNYEKYLGIYKFCIKHLKDIEFNNTICGDTSNRQKEIMRLSKKVDMIIVIGGKNSSNSAKLFEIAKENCKYAQHIETENDLCFSKFGLISAFAVCSGASTPIESVQIVIDYIKKHNKENGVQTVISRFPAQPKMR